MFSTWTTLPVRVEHLDEPAHVGALEFMRQVHEQADGGDGVLQRPLLVADLDGEAQAAHADLVNAQFAVIGFALLVVHHLVLPRGLGRAAIDDHKTRNSGGQHTRNRAVCKRRQPALAPAFRQAACSQLIIHGMPN